ncbi:glucoamylase family protein [Clostridium carnis]
MDNKSVGSRKTVLSELNDAFNGIVHNHRYINKLVKHNEDIIGAGEWLLDNIYLIEKEYKQIKFNLPFNYFANLPTVEDKEGSCPRIYIYAKDYELNTHGKIEEQELIEYVNSMNESFTMGELWAFPLMLRVSLIINLAEVTNKMVVIQKQRAGAKELANTIIDSINNGKIDFMLEKLEKKYPKKKNNFEENITETEKYMGDDKSLHDGLFSAEFIDRFFKILRDNSIEDERVYNFALNRLETKEKNSFENEIIKEHMEEGAIESSIGVIISSLRIIDAIDWKSFFNKTSEVEKILCKDPAKLYKNMDFETKDYYRHKIEYISRKTNISEIILVNKVLDLAEKAINEDSAFYKTHVGYYIIDNGLDELLKAVNFNKKIEKKVSPIKYVSSITLTTLAIDLGVLLLISLLGLNFTLTQYIIAFLIMLIPASEIVIALFNWNIAKIYPKDHIAKLDYSNGIPKEEKTIVVIPTILSNKNTAIELFQKLELYYLANRDKNIYFALLGDFKDSKTKEEDTDNIINEEALKIVQKLNEKYFKDGKNQFYFFNRERIFNEKENIFMGYERKRGKLMEFMALIKGEPTSYNIISSDISTLKDAKYIITLDSDTFLPLGAAKKLIASMAHILNKPVIENKKVIRGYGIMQPKVGVHLEDKNKTYFSKIFAGDAGVDGYSTAASDTYQDLFKEGIFTGKGILEINTFYNMLKDEIQENKILSHDLIEGIFARCALVTDVEVIDGYPAFYASSALRLHRWVRGDWQLFSFLFSSKLSLLSKWKIFDNLRRSLVAPSLLIGLILTLTLFNGAGQIAVLLFLAIIIPLVFTVTDFVVTPKNKLMGTFKSLKQIILILSFIPYQAYLMIDAIIRTIYRTLISKKNLLQWKTASDVESSVVNTLSWYYKTMWISPAIGVVLFLLSFKETFIVGLINLVLVLLWVLAPAIAYKISKREDVISERLSLEDEEFLRVISRSTWAYYEDFVNEENNYLAPDNFQEKPYKGLAYRTSPTNIGMGLITNLISYDLGYATLGDVVYRLENSLEGMKDLEKLHGHYLNWYDTRTKKPLWPRYVSTVDSGNLLGYLLIIKNTLEEFKNKPLIRENELSSLKDTYSLVREEIKEEIYDILPDEIELIDYKYLLEESLLDINKKLRKENSEFEEKDNYWINKLKNEIERKVDFYNYIFDGIEKLIKDKVNYDNQITLIELINLLKDISNASGNEYKKILQKKISKLEDFNERIENIINNLDLIIKEMDFKFLYNEERGLFSIGYNLEENSLGNSYYDLMASEARIASFLSIARGEVPKKHWYNLSRNMAKAFGEKTLVSWSGTMFEYFMPYQIMKCFDNTLWDLTYSSVIKAQKAYGEKKQIPWGISESAYYHFDASENYQYKAFGVPGIGLKRGLEDELVISPYSTIMTLPYDKFSAVENLKRLKGIGATGKYGFIEAIDYTKGEEDKKEQKDVRCYMVHHLGMSLMALDNVLNKNILQERFHKIPEIKAVELLLKEKIPANITFEREVDIYTSKARIERENFVPRVFKGGKRENPEVLLLSNGSYSTMITGTGSGYSKKNDMSIYRWKGDSTTDTSGMFFYIKNLNSNDFWSATYEPCRENNKDEIIEFTLDKASFKRKEGNIETNYEVTLSPEDDVEIRKIIIKNNGEKQRTIEITSYLEVTLQSFEGDTVHPSFSNLFISTEYDEETESLIGNRRARAKGGLTPYILHTAYVKGGNYGALTYETSRLNFIGRNRDLKSPKAMDNDAPLNNTVGIVLDPIMSLRTRVKLEASEEKEICYITLVGDSKEEVLNLAKKYRDFSKIETTLESYNHFNQLELKYLGIKSAQANLYQRLSSYILFLHTGRNNREEYIKNISMNQENLWAYGISGDLPIIILDVKCDEDIDLVRQLVNMHYYFRTKGLKSDLVIYNEEEISYEEPLQKNIGATIRNSPSRDLINKASGIFIHNKATMGEKIKDFLIGISKLYVDSSNGALVKQLREAYPETQENYIRHKELSGIKRIKVEVEEENIHLEETSHKNNLLEIRNTEKGKSDFDKESLDFFNGYGGFNRKNNSYIIRLKNYENTPAPWINVISNEDFGFHISEVGAAYTWCGNSRENKITPWSNDWVMDPLGEALYIRDNTTGVYFSITPKPVRDGGEYIIEHGFGYSTFKHTAYNISGEMKVFCPKGENLKLCRVTLENLSSSNKEISLFYYAQLVLGVYNYASAKYISTYTEKDYIWGQNPYSKYFGKLKAYLSIQGGENISFTGDRREFIGIGEDLSLPKALKEEGLSNKSGAILDPCLASSIKISLKAGEKKEVVVLLGQEETKELMQEKINKYKNIKEVDRELEKVNEYWSNFLGNIQVKTPDDSMNYLLNGWLMYQTLSCRYLSRTAFYQSGGAYGFRDQLQDSMSLGMLNENITREQILRSAQRQYVEGDVQHWWHPVVNSGIRTRFSDDLLWLPYVTIEYINATGDYDILYEKAPYLEDEPLRDGEDERYTIVNNSSKDGTIYEHCIKAIDRGLKFGEHNIPLMGSGDWNDGMSTVGNEGKGESVWLGWFLYKILDGFKELCEHMKDTNKKEEYEKFQEFVRENLEENAWDGGWYRRAYFDDGTPLGSRENDECKIDSLAQSWSVISGAGKESRTLEAMEALDKYLVSKDKGLIMLLAPPFDKSNLEPGYIKGYVAGVRENGGQYTHAAVWVILALTKLGLGDKAWKYYNMINPINHSNTELEARTYKVEPYVMAADVYIKEPHGGRGGWSWYTGASGWMYKVGIENILGLRKIKGEGYKIIPCVPESWNEYTINIKNENEDYTINVVKSKEKGIEINGKPLNSDIIPKNMGKINILVKW